MTPDQDKIERLPQWAQRYITSLKTGLAASEKDLREARDLRSFPSQSTNMKMNEYHGEFPFQLPRDSRVSFHLEDRYDTRVDVHFTDRRTDRRVIEIYASHGALRVSPVSSNVVYVEVET